jgi:hypothetical protein
MNLMSSSKIRYNVDWGLLNLIAADHSAVHEEDTIAILLRIRYCNSLLLITMDEGPYFEDPRPWKFNVYVRCHEEAVQGSCQTVRIKYICLFQLMILRITILQRSIKNSKINQPYDNYENSAISYKILKYFWTRKSWHHVMPVKIRKWVS